MSHKLMATSTGVIAQASAGQSISLDCYVTSIELISNGTNAAVLSVYDGTSSSGVLLATIKVAASTSTPTFITFNTPVAAASGAFTVCTGTGATFVIHYIPS